MKTKSISSGFGVGALIFAVAVVIALPLRTVQFFTVLEGGTGFFSETNWSVWLLYAVLAISIATLLIFGAVKRKKLEYSIETKKRPGMGILSVCAAVGVLLDIVSCINGISNLQAEMEFAAKEQINLNKTASFILSAEAIFAIFSAVFFVALGIALIRGNSNGSQYRLISLSPVLWIVFRIVYRFLRRISYIKVSDLMLEMLMMVFMILFFMVFAQMNSRINAEKNDWKLASYGLPAALLALVCFVPRFIVTISGNTELLYTYSPAEYCDFAIALFILSVVLTRIVDAKPVVNSAPAEGLTEENEDSGE